MPVGKRSRQGSPTASSSSLLLFGRSLSPLRSNTGDSKKEDANYKLKNARDRMQGSFKALLDYLSHHADLHPSALQDIQQTLLSEDESNSHSSSNEQQQHQEKHQQQHFSCGHVRAMGILNQYVDCLDSSTDYEIRTLLVMAAWEALGLYLQQVQRRLQQLCFCPTSLSPTSFSVGSMSPTAASSSESNGTAKTAQSTQRIHCHVFAQSHFIAQSAATTPTIATITTTTTTT
eukprot:CAMPEP_0168794324 /NCGR_PEP_ID=MMETSP0725-20121227/15579_1 /TAXON_ID=265536 /ORGANISM="Amphiprora sp., Strain CCMP467" /LENGTH=231 /DNA_ID=CAMNT_0008845201 /DNA_START=5 /DNA_END=696 /DNA_ORIENTATION=+